MTVRGSASIEHSVPSTIAKFPRSERIQVFGRALVILRDDLAFTYLYDEGGDWRHKVKVEKMVKLDAPLTTALCTEGANACPPEDVGGAPGYEEFLVALGDPKHSEHRELKKMDRPQA